MDVLSILKHLVVLLFIVFSFIPFHISKSYYFYLDILTIIVLSWLYFSKKVRELSIVIAVVFLSIAQFLKNAKCGMCSGLGVGVILANLNY